MGSIVHQGTVYQATSPAVPFLARLASEGVRPAALVCMLGAIAQSVDEHDLPMPGAARAAVAAQLPLLLPLLAAEDGEVRRTTAWTVAQRQSVVDPDARAALWARWAAETDPVVRADVLTACALVSPDAAEELCSAALTESEPAPVQVAALLATVDCGLPWHANLSARVTALLPLDRQGIRRPVGAGTAAGTHQGTGRAGRDRRHDRRGQLRAAAGRSAAAGGERGRAGCRSGGTVGR